MLECLKAFRFYDSKEAVMNFAKCIVAHNLAKFKYFAKQIIFIFEFSSSQALKWYITCLLSTSLVLIKISKNEPKRIHFAKIACKIVKLKYVWKI